MGLSTYKQDALITVEAQLSALVKLDLLVSLGSIHCWTYTYDLSTR